MDYLMLLAVLAGATYMVGMANHGWPTPLDGLLRLSGHRRGADSEPAGGSDVHGEDGDPGDMSGHGRSVVVPRDSVARWGPAPELAHLGGHDGSDDQDGDGLDDERLTRREWVRRAMAAGHRPEWINREGARRFEVSEKTIRRDRAAIEDEEP